MATLRTWLCRLLHRRHWAQAGKKILIPGTLDRVYKYRCARCEADRYTTERAA